MQLPHVLKNNNEGDTTSPACEPGRSQQRRARVTPQAFRGAMATVTPASPAAPHAKLAIDASARQTQK